ncbi:hypothetical protein FACS189487_11300 [Campylobacterota bacterium]|nr:hypothetical protein FACS189487_11300 [Campylobacterota bacterium]
MFGMGLGEILIVAIIAIIFLGPEKLPDTMVKIAKFFRTVKTHLADAKSAIDSELKLSELKSDALEYKEKITREINKDITEITETGSETGREVKDLFGDLSETAKKINNEMKKA